MTVRSALTEEECYLAAILLDRSGLDQAEFLWKDPDPSSGGCYRAMPHQWPWWRCRDPRQVDQGARSTGKALGIQTPIDTPDGWTTIGHLKIGDRVYDINGNPTEVVEVSEVMTGHECWKICFDNTHALLADADHQWVTIDAAGDVALRTSAEIAELAAPLLVPAGCGAGTRLITSITPVPSVPVRCITVADKSGVFLAGRGRIPTHNSEGIMARVLASPLVFPGLETALVAPQKKHIDLLAERIEARIRESRFYSALLAGGSRDAIGHQPFTIRWANGSVLQGKLPLRDGLGLKGLHPAALEVDEGQDLGDRAFAELPEVVRWEIPGARFMIHGVSKGVIDKFYQYTQPGSGFTVHRPMRMHLPHWSLALREQSVKEYGGSDTHPDFLRNVYGQHAGSQNRIVILTNLYKCVDIDESSIYNTEVYCHLDLTPERIARVVADRHGPDAAEAPIEEVNQYQIDALNELLVFPETHRDYKLTWGGMDFGLVGDPSELLVAAEYQPSPDEIALDRKQGRAIPDKGMSRLRLLTRIHFERLPPGLQQELVLRVVEFYGPRALSMDKTGNGLPVFIGLQSKAVRDRIAVIDYTDGEEAPFTADARAQRALTKIKGYNFSSKIVFEFDDAIIASLGENPSNEDIIEKAGIKRWVKDAATDLVRDVVDNRRLKAPSDGDFINDINAQTWAQGVEPVDAYGRRRYTYSAGTYHILDAFRMLLIGRHMDAIEDFMKTPTPEKPPVFVRFG